MTALQAQYAAVTLAGPCWPMRTNFNCSRDARGARSKPSSINQICLWSVCTCSVSSHLSLSLVMPQRDQTNVHASHYLQLSDVRAWHIKCTNFRLGSCVLGKACHTCSDRTQQHCDQFSGPRLHLFQPCSTPDPSMPISSEMK